MSRKITILSSTCALPGGGDPNNPGENVLFKLDHILTSPFSSGVQTNSTTNYNIIWDATNQVRVTSNDIVSTSFNQTYVYPPLGAGQYYTYEYRDFIDEIIRLEFDSQDIVNTVDFSNLTNLVEARFENNLITSLDLRGPYILEEQVVGLDFRNNLLDCAAIYNALSDLYLYLDTNATGIFAQQKEITFVGNINCFICDEREDLLNVIDSLLNDYNILVDLLDTTLTQRIYNEGAGDQLRHVEENPGILICRLYNE